MIYGNTTYATLTGGSTQDAYQVRLGYEVLSEEIAKNSREIKLQLEVRSVKSNYGTYGYNQTTMIDGTKYASKVFDMRNTNTWQIFGTKTITIEGAYSGTKSGSFETDATTSSGLYTLKKGEAFVALNLTALHQAPKISYTLSEQNTNLTGVADTNWVLGLSKKRYTISATAYDEATITNYAIYQKNTLKASSASNIIDLDTANITFSTEDNAIPLTIKVTDSLGGVGTIDLYYNDYIQYILPSFISSATTAKRNGQVSGKANLNAKATFYNGTVGLATNSVTIKFRYWEKGSTEPSTYTTIPSSSISISGNNITISNYQLGTDFDYLSSYNVRLSINDNFKSSIWTGTVLVGKAVWSEYKDRVEFIKITQNGKEIALKEEMPKMPSVPTNVSMSLITLVSSFSYTAVSVNITGCVGIYIKVLPITGGAYVPVFIPVSDLNTTRQIYQGADESNYVAVALTKSGNNLTIQAQERSASSGDYAIYGVKLVLS